MVVAAPPQIYILQRSCHHNLEPINLNPEPNLCFQTSVSNKKSRHAPFAHRVIFFLQVYSFMTVPSASVMVCPLYWIVPRLKRLVI